MKNIEPSIIDNIQVFTQLSRIDVWNKHKQNKEHMYIVREEKKTFRVMLIFRDFVMS